MQTAAEIQIKVSTNAAKAATDVNKLDDSLNKTEKSTKNVAKSLLGAVGLTAGIAGAAVAAKQLAGFLLDSAKAASNAEETFAKYYTVFSTLGRDASDAVDDLADSFGLADSTAARLLGNTGDLLTGFGLSQEAALELSDATTRLAVDLASFTNAAGGAEAVSRALTSAFSGERESLKTYGIVINEAAVQTRVLENAQEGLTFETEQQARAFATLQLAQEQSKNAIGDYERTSDSAANVQRRLNEQVLQFKENLGTSVSEGITPFRAALADMLEDLNTAADNRNNFESALMGGALETTDYEAAIAAAQRGINVLVQSIQQAENNPAISDGFISTLKEELRDAIKEMAAMQAAYQALQRTAAEQKAEEERAAGEAVRTWQSYRDEANAAISSAFAQIEEQGSIADALGEDFDVTAEKAAVLREQIRGLLSIPASEIDEIFLLGDNSIQALIDRLKELVGQSEEVAKETAETFAGLTEGYSMASREMTDEALAYIEEQNEKAAEKAREDWIKSFGEVTDYIGSAFDSLDTIADNFSNAEIMRLQEEVDAYEEGTAEKEAAEEKLQKAKRKAAREDALRRQALGLFEVGVNTASAVAEALPNIPLSIAVGALGAVQAAAILSEPIPAAATGGSFIVPPGNAADSGLLRVSSGERVSVTPARQSGGSSNQTVQIVVNGRVLGEAVMREFNSGNAGRLEGRIVRA